MSVIDIGNLQLLASFIFVGIVLLISKGLSSKHSDVILAVFRMCIQLIVCGFVLVYIINLNTFFLTMTALIAMEVYAFFNITKRFKTKLNRRLKKAIFIALFFGTAVSISYFVYFVFLAHNSSRYIIVIAGMIIGNTLNALSLAIKYALDSLNEQRVKITTLLMLAVPGKKAAFYLMKNGYEIAIIPTINSMLGTGIVFLPGMMSGQIISGIDPILAVKYQMVIMLAIFASVSLTVVGFLYLCLREIFDENENLVI